MEDQKTLTETWDAVISDNTLGAPIPQDKKSAIAQMLENQAVWNYENRKTLSELNESAPENYAADVNGSSTGNIQGYDPVLMGVLRRAAPSMIAFDIAGVQPLTQPTGLIFIMKARYGSGTGSTDRNLLDNLEALFDEANTAFAGKGTHAGTNPAVLNDTTPGTYSAGTAMTTLEGETLGDGTANWGSMGFTIEKTAILTGTRGLEAGYTNELQQDLKAVHGMDADKILSELLASELLFEINREVLRDLYISSEIGAQEDTTTVGIFDLDTDSNGRWSGEKFKGLHFQLEREKNQIATRTRRGKGNVMVCTQDVASALVAAGVLDYAPALQAMTNLTVDPIANTFAGMIGNTKVFVDPYINTTGGKNFALMGYKGSTLGDAGYFYCPYQTLQMYKATDPKTFQPKIAFKTRYGKGANPFANNSTTTSAIVANTNRYYRKIQIRNIL
jgi:hypothetical protein